MVERTRAIRYQEDPVGASAMRPRRRGEHMIKQTYSVWVQVADGSHGMKKWHLNAYWTQESLDELLTVDHFSELRSLDVPPGTYLCARTNRMRETIVRPAKGNAFPTSPSLYVSAPGLSLAPLELLEGGRRFPRPRDPADEVMIRSFNFHHRN